MTTDIVLALGGGGTRGIAHVGVLRFLEDHDFRIRALAGTSIGSVVAALYASGIRAKQLEILLESVEPASLFGGFLSEGPGLLSLREIRGWLIERFGERRFEDLELPCAAVVVDVHTQQTLFLHEGEIVPALLGSVAVPGIFPPVEYPPYLLIDGGTLDPVPVRAARMLAPNLPVVAVSLQTGLGETSAPFAYPIHVPKPIQTRIRRLRIAQAFNIFVESVLIGQRQLSAMRLAIDAPDVLIHPAVNDFSIFESVEVSAIVKRGEQAALQAYPGLRKVGTLTSRLRRRLRRQSNP